jgi:hypothetical protein
MPHKPLIFDLTTRCASCGYKIPPAEIVRPKFDHVLCPKCGTTFTPKGKFLWPGASPLRGNL